MANDKEVKLVPGKHTGPVEWAKACAIMSNAASGGIAIQLSDETKSRLAHLEAIEALQQKKDSESCGFEYMVIADKIEDLIRKGMKDNV